MTDNKFTTMMLRKENLCEQAAVEHENDGYDALASAARDEASDWRAMREAWEAMVEACEEALIEIGYSMNPSGIVIDKLDTALAKARGE